MAVMCHPEPAVDELANLFGIEADALTVEHRKFNGLPGQARERELPLWNRSESRGFEFGRGCWLLEPASSVTSDPRAIEINRTVERCPRRLGPDLQARVNGNSAGSRTNTVLTTGCPT